MTATYSVNEEPTHGHPLGRGASPAAIRAALLPEDQHEFDVAYERALGEARSSLDLTDLFTMLDRWRRLAALQSDPEVFRRVARRAAELHTGESRPSNESLAESRTHTGM